MNSAIYKRLVAIGLVEDEAKKKRLSEIASSFFGDNTTVQQSDIDEDFSIIVPSLDLESSYLKHHYS